MDQFQSINNTQQQSNANINVMHFMPALCPPIPHDPSSFPTPGPSFSSPGQLFPFTVSSSIVCPPFADALYPVMHQSDPQTPILSRVRIDDLIIKEQQQSNQSIKAKLDSKTSIKHDTDSPLKTEAVKTEVCPAKKKKVQPKKDGHACNECGKSFKFKSHLKRHQASHSKSKPYKCDLCSKSFGHQYYLQDHVRYNHIKNGKTDRKFTCDICHKKFRLKINLTNHLRIHSGEKPFKCNNCGKAFTQKGNCDAHHRACTGIKPFKCDECGKQFTRKMYLQQHMRTHTGSKPFECDVCNKAFSIKSNMVKHKKARHKS